jgi:hypothetical protein
MTGIPSEPTLAFCNRAAPEVDRASIPMPGESFHPALSGTTSGPLDTPLD